MEAPGNKVRVLQDLKLDTAICCDVKWSELNIVILQFWEEELCDAHV